MNPVKLGVTLCLLGLAFASCDAPTSSNQPIIVNTPSSVTSAIPTGVWGGQDAKVEIQSDGSALITYDCGSGGTSVPIVPDPNNNGQFDAVGTYQSFVDPNNPVTPPTLNVDYSGNINADGSMTFQVNFNPNDTVPNGAPGQEQVAPGAAPQLVDCPVF